jgi:hypothetical protein
MAAVAVASLEILTRKKRGESGDSGVNRCDVEVSINIAKARTGIHASGYGRQGTASATTRTRL